MTTQSEDEHRRGGFREAVNELFGKGEHGDDTNRLDELDRDDARRHEETGGGSATSRHAYDERAAGRSGAGQSGAGQSGAGQSGAGQASDPRYDDDPGRRPDDARYDDDPGRRPDDADRHDAGVPGGTGDAGVAQAAHPGETATDRPSEGGHPADRDAYGDAPAGANAADPGAQRTPQGQPVRQGEQVGDAAPPHGGEVRGDTVAPESVRQGGDPTAQGQVQHGGEPRGDPGLTRQDATPTGGPADAGMGNEARSGGTAATAAGTGTAAGAGAGLAAASAGAARHDADQHDTDRHDTDAGASDDGDERAALVTRDRAESYGSRWDSVKGAFVDEPRRAVADADALVGELLDELQELFTQQRHQIEQGLERDETSTEDLRIALRRYRSFFDRLLSI